MEISPKSFDTLLSSNIHYHNSVRYAASYTLKQRGKGSSPNVAEVIMFKKLTTGSPVGEVQIRVSAETTSVRIK